jgi:multiple sugar transport system substrate-binding protein
LSIRRRLGAALVALLAGAGCRSVHDGATVVDFWAMGREGEVVVEMLPEFERAHPGIRVRVQQIPWSAAHEKLLTAFVGGAMPDVFQAGNTWLPELVALGAVEPLDARIAASTVVALDDYFPGIRASNVVDGATYGVPWYADTRLLFYRADALPEPPRTWNAWRDAMERIAAGAGAGHYAILLPLREWEAPVILALQRGATLLRDGDRYGDFQSPPFREAFAFYVNLFRNGLAPRTGTATVANLYQDFAGGLFALYLSGPWNLGEFARRLPPTLAWSTAPLPAPDGGYPGVSLAGGGSLVLHRASSRKDAAWQLVEYLTSPAAQVRFYRLTGDLPARRSAWTSAALDQDARAGAFWQQLQAVRPTPMIPEWERIAARIGRHAEAAIRGETAVDEALTALDGDVDRILEKRRWLLGRAPAGEP